MAKETMYTPFTECLWAFLQVPKPAEGKFKSIFQITLVFDHKEHAEILKQLSDLNKAAKGPEKMGADGHPIKPHWQYVTDDCGERIKQVIPNKYQVRFKTNAEGTYSPDHIMTYDSQGQIINRDKNFVANGSIVCVSWSFGNYDGGVSLYLNGVQIKELIEWKGKTFEDLGFKKVEGYTSGDSVPAVDGYQEPGDDLGEQDGSPTEEEDDLPF
ncbi:MAG: hypothetical protein ACW99F_13465 [Candidatus Hodarchaeales archaeon]|jgi:hypothetical protein